MRRVLRVIMLAGVVAGGSAAQAASSPQLRDRMGDWHVPSQDFVGGRLSTTNDRTLVGELALSAAPSSGVATRYGFYFFDGSCLQWGFDYAWTGAATTSEAAFTRTDFCAGELVPPTEEFPATVSVAGTTLTWRAPYAAGMRDGVVLHGFSASACAGPCGAWSKVGGGPGVSAWVGDVGHTSTRYVVGSERRRA